MSKKLGLSCIMLFSVFLILTVVYSDHFSKGLLAVASVSISSMIPLGFSLLVFDLETKKREKIKKAYLIVAIVIIAVGMMSSFLRWPGARVEIIIGVLWYCFAFAPLALKHKFIKWKPFSNSKFDTFLLSIIDFLGINLLLLGALFKIQRWPLANNMMYIGFFTIAIGLLFWNSKFKKEVILRKISEDKLKEKNKEITDSITYAKRIQSAILPQPKLVKEYLDSFILYKPKDIVAGDFYWFEVIENTIFFAAADCTGHGVPGAMVSVVCNNALNRSAKEFNLKKPAEILDKTREIVISEFEKSDEEVKDGMDISLCVVNQKANTLAWSGAHNPLWILRNNEIIEYKADKQPIGKFSHAKPFTEHAIEIQENDEIYIFTDGFQDQFGGEKGKKFKASQLKNLLISNFRLPMNEKFLLLEQTFENWKGTLEQVDDVCVIGFKL